MEADSSAVSVNSETDLDQDSQASSLEAAPLKEEDSSTEVVAPSESLASKEGHSSKAALASKACASSKKAAENASRFWADEWSERFGHKPVMVSEAMEALRVLPDGLYVDGTLGGGGHARAILKRLGPDGRLLGLDLDPGPLEFAREWGAGDPRLALARLNFKRLAGHLSESGLGPADGVMVDLGLSSSQLLNPERGFSFSFDGPLDMRLNPGSGLKAGDIVNNWSEGDIADILKRFGEERMHRRLAAAIVSERAAGPIDSTAKLAALAQKVLGRPGPPQRIHPATRMFMGLRLAVNDELESLAAFLAGARECLKPGGRLVVISFHSLEDRLVKEAFRGASAASDSPVAMHGGFFGGRPESAAGAPSGTPIAWRPLRRKVVKPSELEIALNPRARSAKLRGAEAVSGAEAVNGGSLEG